MILKSYEIKKLDPDKFKIYLFYGKNEGQKKEVLNHLAGKNKF